MLVAGRGHRLDLRLTHARRRLGVDQGDDPSRTHIEGTVLAIEPEALRLRISMTSSPKQYAKGETAVPRSAVSVIRTTKETKYWRLLLAPGIPAAALGAMAAATSGVSPTPDPQKVVPIGLGVAVGTTVAGYGLGNSLDSEVTEIFVIGAVNAPEH